MSAVYELDPLQDSRWEPLVESHVHGGIFHSRGWLSALRDAYRYEPWAVTTSPPGEELKNALVFCRVRSWLTGSRLVSLPFSDHCEPLTESPERLTALLDYVQRAAVRQSLKYVEVRPSIADLPGSSNFAAGESFHFHRLPLEGTADTLFRSFHKDCIQRKIRRAEREALVYEEGASEEILQQFYKLLLLTRRRHQLPPQPLSWFRNLIANLGEALKIRIAFKDGTSRWPVS